MMIYTRSVQFLQRSCKTILRMALFGVCMLLMFSSPVKAVDQKNITSTAGRSVVLPCTAPSNMLVLVVEWNRDGLEGYVVSCREENLDPEGQDASYMNRVDLIDRQMKNRNLSLLLRNVTVNDSGTYECKAFHEGASRRKRQDEVLSIIKLDVRPSDGDGAVSDAGTEGNHLQLSALVLVPALVLILVTIVICKRKNWINIGAAAPCRYEMTSTSQ